FLEKVREGLLHARRILDFDAGNFQPQNGKAHRHAVVVVGLDGRAVKLRREYFQRVSRFDDFGAALGQFGAQRNNALALLDTETAEVSEAVVVASQWRNHNRRHNAVAQVRSTGDSRRTVLGFKSLQMLLAFAR